jgi:hypothetical protein
MLMRLNNVLISKVRHTITGISEHTSYGREQNTAETKRSRLSQQTSGHLGLTSPQLQGSLGNIKRPPITLSQNAGIQQSTASPLPFPQPLSSNNHRPVFRKQMDKSGRYKRNGKGNVCLYSPKPEVLPFVFVSTTRCTRGWLKSDF